MTLQDQLAIIQAAIDGKPIEFQGSDGEWQPLISARFPGHPCQFDFANSQYRVKPPPREWWLVQGGGCGCGSDEVRGFHAYSVKQETRRAQIHVREVLDE